MKRLLRWTLRAFLGFLLLIVVAVLCRSPLLKAFSAYRLHDATGLRAEIGTVRTSLGLVTTTVKDFRILNPEEFGQIPLAVVPELSLVLDPQPAASGKIRFKEARVTLAEFNMVRSPDGRLNLDEVGRLVRDHLRRRRKRFLEMDFGGIDRLYLTLGDLNFVDPRQPERNWTIHLGVTNELVTTIQSEDDFHAWVGLFVVRLAMQEYLSQSGDEKKKSLQWLLQMLRPKD
jgi:hypothetical protein